MNEKKEIPSVKNMTSESANVEKPRNYTPGDGIRSVKTTNVFRVVNFELYARPNKLTMGLGLCAISFCVGYLTYLHYFYDKDKFYEAFTEDGTKVLRPKKSRWE